MVDYAHTGLLKEGHGCLHSGGSVRLLAVVPPALDGSEAKTTLIPWPKQLRDKLLRKSKNGCVKLHKLPQIKDLETVQTVLECLPKDCDFECCLFCMDLDSLLETKSEDLYDQLSHMVKRVRDAGRECVLITPPPIKKEENVWCLDLKNDDYPRILADIREVANGLKVPFVDLFAMWKMGLGLKALKEELVLDQSYGITHYGHAIIADQLWEAFNMLKEQTLEYNWID